MGSCRDGVLWGWGVVGMGSCGDGVVVMCCGDGGVVGMELL